MKRFALLCLASLLTGWFAAAIYYHYQDKSQELQLNQAWEKTN